MSDEKVVAKHAGKMADALVQAIRALREKVDTSVLKAAIARGDLKAALAAADVTKLWRDAYEQVMVDSLTQAAVGVLSRKHEAALSEAAPAGVEAHKRSARAKDTSFIDRWVEDHAGEEVARTSKLEAQTIKDAIRRVMADDGFDADDAAEMIKQTIGLTPQQSASLEKYREELLDEGDDDEPAYSRAEIKALLAERSDEMLAQRADTIAYNETQRAMSASQMQAWETLEEDGVIDEEWQKEWVVTSGERACDICAPMEGLQVGIKEEFSDGISMPPDPHIGCECMVILIDPADIEQNAEARARAEAHGESVGHPFRGNQWSKGEGEGDSQVSFEAQPSTATALLRGLHDAPMEMKHAYLRDAVKALDVDDIAKSVGLKGAAIERAGFYDDPKVGPVSSPSIQFLIHDDGSDDTREKIEAFAASVGYLLRQDSVGYHRPVHEDRLPECNASEITLAEPVTPEILKSVDAAMRARGEDAFALVSSEKGFRVLNFGSSDGTAFNRAVKAAVEAGTPDTITFEQRAFKSDGDLISNDWSKDQNGQGYISRNRAAGRPDVQGAVARANGRLEVVNRRWEALLKSYKRGDQHEAGDEDEVERHGDLPGHEFRGNQWTGGKGAGRVFETKAKDEADLSSAGGIAAIGTDRAHRLARRFSIVLGEIQRLEADIAQGRRDAITNPNQDPEKLKLLTALEHRLHFANLEREKVEGLAAREAKAAARAEAREKKEASIPTREAAREVVLSKFEPRDPRETPATAFRPYEAVGLNGFRFTFEPTIKTPAQFKKALSDLFPEASIGSIPKAADPHMMTMIHDEFRSLRDEYPEIVLRELQFTRRGGGMAVPTQDKIVLGRALTDGASTTGSWSSTEQKRNMGPTEKATLEKGIPEFHDGGESYAQVVRHEFAHLMEQQIIGMTPMRPNMQGLPALKQSAVSQYARKNRTEWFAEAFAFAKYGDKKTKALPEVVEVREFVKAAFADIRAQRKKK